MKSGTNEKLFRARTGCITCRIRKVKCDEAKPACKRCMSTGRTCDGYTATSMSRRQLIGDGGSPNARTPSPSIINNDLESRSFDFFRVRTLANVANSLDHQVWDGLVMRLSHSEPAIKHSMLTLSLLHQRRHLIDALKPANMEDIMVQHQNALMHSRRLLNAAQHDDMTKVLVVCMLFVCYGNLTGQYETAQVHLKSGLRMLQELRQKSTLYSQPGTPKHQTRDSDVESLAEALACLDFQAMTFSDSKAPYPYSLYPMLSGTENGTPISPHPVEFSTLGDASNSLMSLTRSYLYLLDKLEKGELLYAELMTRQIDYIKALKGWEQGFENMKSHDLKLSTSTQALLLRIYHILLRVLLKFDYSGSECHWDPFFPDFVHIIDVASELAELDENMGLHPDISFSFSIGITIPLFITATRCRDPKVRREAIKIMRDKRRIEGVWDSVGAAAVAEKVVQIEEAEGVHSAGVIIIPEEARVHATFTTVDLEERSVSVRCLRLRQADGSGNPWEEIKAVVKF